MFRVNDNEANKNIGVSYIFLSENSSFCQRIIIFFAKADQANTVSKSCSERFYKIS